MLMGKLREREVMMVSRTSSSVKVVSDLVRVCRGGHFDLDDDVLAFVGIVVVIDSAVDGAAGLELNVFGASGALFFEERGDYAGG